MGKRLTIGEYTARLIAKADAANAREDARFEKFVANLKPYKAIPAGSSFPEYNTWRNMLSRCYDSRNRCFHRYGGRGITVCERWKKNYNAFLNDMGRKPSPRHSIDRRNNNGNYEPSNCRWATPRTQMRNTSRSKKYRLIAANCIINSPNIIKA